MQTIQSQQRIHNMDTSIDVAAILTEEDIRPIYFAINLSPELNDHDSKIVGSSKKYFLKTWIDGLRIQYQQWSRVIPQKSEIIYQNKSS